MPTPLSPFVFKDKHGREWNLALDFAICRRVDSFDKTAVIKEPFSLLAPDRALLHRLLYTDRGALFALIWAIIQPQLSEQGITLGTTDAEIEAAELEFLSGINGPVIEMARRAFSEALGDFFPELLTVLSTWEEQYKMVMDKAAKKMEHMKPMMEEMAETEFNNLLMTYQNQLKTRSAKHGEVSMP